MGPDLAELVEVQDLLGDDLDEVETRKVTSWIVRASALIRLVAPTIDERMYNGTMDPAIVRGIAAEMVTRAVQADRIGFRVRSEAFPEVTTQYRDSDEPLLYLLDYERDLLCPTVKRRPGAFSIRPGFS
ncbi:MAG: hypothetical protein ACI39C_07435 [Dietzia sp.]